MQHPAANPDPAMATLFKVVGLQRTGTNLMRALLERNFLVDYLEEASTGWKHGPLRNPNGVWDGIAARFVLCVKNPYAWAVSCYRYFCRDRGADVTICPHFIRKPAESFEDFAHRPHYSWPTPFHRWNQMNRLWLSTLPHERRVVVRQEDQLTDQLRVLSSVEQVLGLKRRHPNLDVITRVVDTDARILGPFDGEYYLKRTYLEQYGPGLLREASRMLDGALMTELNYDVE
jgi:hypothetical protein